MDKSYRVIETASTLSLALISTPTLASLTFSESGIHTLIFSRVRLKHSPILLFSIYTDSLPRPWLSADPVHWITPGLSTFLLCQARVQGVVFLLRREGDEGFLEVAETDGFLKGAGPSGSLDVTQAGYKEHAIFLVHQPGNYSCSYQTHGECAPSKPSGIVTIEEYGEC